MVTILGAGLAGISSSFHLGHENCIVFEKNDNPGGHIYSYEKDNCIWDEGPHVSFTKNEYVKNLFASATEILDYPVEVGNYFKGTWIPHPAQSNLFAVPQYLREQCLNDFLESRKLPVKDRLANYEEWLIAAFGKTFYENFPSLYTRKYWTVHPKLLTTDWVGDRVFYPEVEDVKQGFFSPPDKSSHYITTVRYPRTGGYYSFAKKMAEGMNLHTNHELKYISFKEKFILFENGLRHNYSQLINTIPLPELIFKCDAPEIIRDAASMLSCSSLLLVNIVADHPTAKAYNWLYVYDTDKYSTRINFSEKLSPNNAPSNKTAIQVEVYFSKYKPISDTKEAIAKKVCEELIEMGLILSEKSIEKVHTKWVQWANVIFDFERRSSLELIWRWLEQYGLNREEDDLEPMTNWNKKADVFESRITMAGRFAQWKYYWSDDCVLRGKSIKIRNA